MGFLHSFPASDFLVKVGCRPSSALLRFQLLISDFSIVDNVVGNDVVEWG